MASGATIHTANGLKVRVKARVQGREAAGASLENEPVGAIA